MMRKGCGHIRNRGDSLELILVSVGLIVGSYASEQRLDHFMAVVE
jgi:hypothetical protein